MLTTELDKLVVALTVVTAVLAPQAKPPAATGNSVAPAAVSPTPTDPSAAAGDGQNYFAQASIDPPSTFAVRVLDTLGLTKKARQPLPPINIPNDLSNKKPEEIMNYAYLLMNQRRKLQNRMTRYMAYNCFLLLFLHLFGTSSLVKGGTAGLFWLNNNYRETINADWMVHQHQLSEFIFEYRRIKNVDIHNLSTSRIVGVPILNVEYSKGNFVNFPVWTTEKGQAPPVGASITTALPLVKNWWMR